MALGSCGTGIVRMPLFDPAPLKCSFFQGEAAGTGNWLHKGRQLALHSPARELDKSARLWEPPFPE